MKMYSILTGEMKMPPQIKYLMKNTSKLDIYASTSSTKVMKTMKNARRLFAATSSAGGGSEKSKRRKPGRWPGEPPSGG